jgi:Spy/CpxP family protein refolding chaperone
MNRTNSFRALTLAATLALSASLAACAPAANQGGGTPMAVTRGSAIVPPNGVAENNSDDAQATGNPLTARAPAQR